MGDDAAHGSEMQMFESGEQQKSDELLDAVTRGEVETAARAIEMGADVDTAMNENGCTALHIAVHRGDHEMLTLLLSLKPNLECRTHVLKLTPLHCAVSSRSLECVKLLLEAGANFEAMNDTGERALHIAIQRADAQIIKALVIRGANRHVPAPCMWDSMASSPPRSHSTWRLFACAAVCAWLTPLGQAPKTPVEMASELHPRIAKSIRKALHSEDTDAGVWSNHGMSFKGSVAVLRSESDDSD